MYRRYLVQFLLGALIGALLAALLLPDPAIRLRSAARRATAIPSVDRAWTQVALALARARAAARVRYESALQESRITVENARRELWQRFESARRGQRLPGA